MNTFEYGQEAREASKEVQDLQGKQLSFTPGTIDWDTWEVKVLAAKIKYHDRMYDMYDSQCKTAEANRHRRLMEDCIRKRKDLIAFLDKVNITIED